MTESRAECIVEGCTAPADCPAYRHVCERHGPGKGRLYQGGDGRVHWFPVPEAAR